MPAAITYDPHKTWYIATRNKAYTGKANGVTFHDGQARVDGVSKTATPDALARHVEKLNWFSNDPAYSFSEKAPDATPEAAD